MGWSAGEMRGQADERFLQDGGDYIDPDRWYPVVYKFRHYYDLSAHELGKTIRA